MEKIRGNSNKSSLVTCLICNDSLLRDADQGDAIQCLTCTARFHSQCIYRWMEISGLPLDKACPTKCAKADAIDGNTDGSLFEKIPDEELAKHHAQGAPAPELYETEEERHTEVAAEQATLAKELLVPKMLMNLRNFWYRTLTSAAEGATALDENERLHNLQQRETDQREFTITVGRLLSWNVPLRTLQCLLDNDTSYCDAERATYRRLFNTAASALGREEDLLKVMNPTRRRGTPPHTARRGI